ncbi:hypothetical protein B7486_73665, partial [cyanobacterium TDX16]
MRRTMQAVGALLLVLVVASCGSTEADLSIGPDPAAPPMPADTVTSTADATTATTGAEGDSTA